MGTRTGRAVLVVLVAMALGWAVGPARGQTVIFVDASATGAGNGSSWADAYTSVQPALNAAISGQQVWVAAGRYVGTITLKLGVGLYGGFAGVEDPATFDLAERDFVANETILDGNRAGSVVTAPSGATATTRIDGFTITNGIGTLNHLGDHLGGGLYLSGCSPTIANNMIVGNSASCGGGVFLWSSSPTITNNTIGGNSSPSGGGLYLNGSSPRIENNALTNNQASEGGGLYVDTSSSPTIAHNTITGNVSIGWYGGGLYFHSSSGAIADNTIAGNVTAFEGGGVCLVYSSPTTTGNTIESNDAGNNGGGLYLSESSTTLTNNHIRCNRAGTSGGGVHVRNYSPAIRNNAIANNSAAEGGGMWLAGSPTISNNVITGNGASDSGGGLSVGGSATITNNTITGNGATDDGGGVYLGSSASPNIRNTIIAFNSSGVFRSSTTSAPTITYSCVYGNTEYNYSGMTDPTGTTGNISADPRLADTVYGNVHIQPTSPCVNAGNNSYAVGSSDMDGERRIQPVGGRVDMGADESNGAVWPPGPYAVVRVSPAGDDEQNGASWALAKRTVQAGIDAASALGGEVWVSAGTYRERILLHPYAHLYGGFAGNETERDTRDWEANVTVLDGEQQGSVVTVRAGEHAGTVDGFTITNGNGDTGGGFYLCRGSPTIANNTICGNLATHTPIQSGGGLYLWFASPMIVNNTITGNSAVSNGGGLYLYSSSAAIVDNRITGNSAPSGGGLTLTKSSPTITNNTINGNRATDYHGRGGGLQIANSSSPIIANNTITGNFASGHWGSGGGLYIDSASPTITGNAIRGNVAEKGGGLYVNASSPTIANNTVTANGASSGGGLYLNKASPIIANTIVAFNSSGMFLEGTGAPALRHNCVYGNTGYSYSGLTDPSGSNGNISVDPRLADQRYGNGHIQPDSPCVDAGSNAWAVGDFDVDGQMRIQPQSGTVDIGADESDGTVWPAGVPVVVRVSPTGDDRHEGSSWVLAKRTVQAGIDEAARVGGEVWVQAGTYYERITLYPYAYAYGGFSGAETERGDRDWQANVTILDGQQQGSVVTVRAGDGAVSAIDGFTITNGTGRMDGGSGYGGGLYLSNSSPTIANNTIINNRVTCCGGGLYVLGGTPTIRNNAITGNSTTQSSGHGGGIYLSGSSPMIIHNTITGNWTTDSHSDGGGLYVSGGSPTITCNTITNNWTSDSNGEGGGLYLWGGSAVITGNAIADNSALMASGAGLYVTGASPTIVGNTMAGNVAYFGGGALWVSCTSGVIEGNTIACNDASYGVGLYISGSPRIVNNTIVGNHASSAYGGGIYVADKSSPTIINTVVAFNSSGVYQNGTSGTPSLQYNCVYGNDSYNYYGIADPTGTGGNISAEPRFVQDPDPGPDGSWGTSDDVVGDLHLRWISPAIDGGTNGVVAAGVVDLDGHPRVLGGRVDMGAYEFGIGDFNCDRKVDEEDAARLTECMTGPGEGGWRGVVGLPAQSSGHGTQHSGLGLGGAGGTDGAAGRPREGAGRYEGGWGPSTQAGAPAAREGTQMAETAYGPGCEAFDFEADGDVDLRDFAGFMGVFMKDRRGDYDGDGDIDLDDYGPLGECLFGPGIGPSPAAPMLASDCLSVFDFEGDGDVDLGDFAAFQEVFTESSWGDYDGDGDVDVDDYAGMADCVYGPGVSVPAALASECLGAFDVEGDGDVDLSDFAAFERVFGRRW